METYITSIIKKNNWNGTMTVFIIKKGENIEDVYSEIVAEYGNKTEYIVPEFQKFEFNILRM